MAAISFSPSKILSIQQPFDKPFAFFLINNKIAII